MELAGAVTVGVLLEETRPRRRPDLFRVAGPVQNDPHPGQVDSVGHQPTISKRLKK